jgi:hypothetical protein
MAKLYSMAQMTVSAAPGTGTISLGAAAAADGITYQTFAQAGIQNADVVSYRIRDGAAWEVGRGTYTATGTTLSRGLLFSSTGALIAATAAALVSIDSLGEDFTDIQTKTGLGAPSCSWLAGANPKSAVMVVANRALTITGISVVIMASNAGATVTVKNKAGTALHTPAFDLSQAANLYNITPLAVTALAANDYLWLDTAGTFTASVGNVTVFVV